MIDETPLIISDMYSDHRFVSPLDIEQSGITWEQFVKWTESDRISAERMPKNWYEYIASQINGCVVVDKIDAREMLAEIKNVG